MVSATEVRLVPCWLVVSALLLAGLTLASALLLSLAFDGALGWSFRAMSVAAALVLVSAVSALARRRRRREPHVGPDGTRTFVAPGATVWPLVALFPLVLVMAGLWCYVVVTDFDSIESPGATLVTVGAAVAMLPDLARLLTGRLHRWQLVLAPESFTYRGYRTDVTVPWAKVGRATIRTKGPAGVLVNIRGESRDPVIPYTAFDIPAEQMIEEIERAKAARHR